jgi:hypothetical protein
MVERVHIGGLRWGQAYVTWPLARLVIGQEGVRVESSRKVLGPLFRLRKFGFDELDFNWQEIETVFPSEGLLPSWWLLNHHVSFVVGDGTMVWWSPSAEDATEVLTEVGDLAPEKVRSEYPRPSE